MESLYTFWDAVVTAPSLVWTVAFIMSGLTGWMLHNYLDDFLYSLTISIIMYCSILVANAGFAQIGLFFTTDREANIVAAAGASICAVTLMTLIFVRIFYAIGDFHQKLKRADEERSV